MEAREPEGSQAFRYGPRTASGMLGGLSGLKVDSVGCLTLLADCAAARSSALESTARISNGALFWSPLIKLTMGALVSCTRHATPASLPPSYVAGLGW